MHNKTPDPDIQRLLRTAGWLWLGYLLALAVIDLLMYKTINSWVYYVINGAAALVFLGLSYWGRVSRGLKVFYLPLMLALIAGLPLVVNHLMQDGLRGDNMASPEGMALRQLPVLFVALVITAWQYGLPGVILFSGFTALLELLTVVLVAPWFTFVSVAPPPSMPHQFSPTSFRSVDVFVFLALVRTASFVAVGVFLSQLIERLHRQQRSLADANARLAHYASTLESLTVSRERNRMAHELHDTLAHSLTALSVQLETVKAYWDVDRAKSHELLDRSLAATRSGLEETRRALKSLRATPLEEMGLRLALRQLAESAASRGGLDLELALPDSLPFLSPDVEQCIYRIAQESIENALAHAGAKHLTVNLAQEKQSITLTIRDDGKGFDPTDAGKAGHFGLTGMRERAEIAGGTFTVDSNPGAGTTVTLTIGAAL